jgi:hypothetical protein
MQTHPYRLILFLLALLFAVVPAEAVQLPEPEPIPQEMSSDQRQRLSARSTELLQTRADLQARIDRHNAECSDVPASDSGRLQRCREQEISLKKELEIYAQAWRDFGQELLLAKEQDEFDRMNDVWMQRQQVRIQEAAQRDNAWTTEVLQSIQQTQVPVPNLHRPRKLEDLRPGDILLVTPEGTLSKTIVSADLLIRSANHLSRGEISRAVQAEKAPVSHALTFVKSVGNKQLFLDHRKKEGSRILDQAQLRHRYGHRGIYVARPQMVVDGRQLWQAAREAALKKKSDFGLFGEDVVCSERAALAVAKATGGQSLAEHRLGPVDITPGDFFDREGPGKYFIVSPLEEWFSD